jgi:hypothetical protein
MVAAAPASAQFVPGGPNCPEGTEQVWSATGEVFCHLPSTYGPLPQACPFGYAPAVLVRPQGGLAFTCALLNLEPPPAGSQDDYTYPPGGYYSYPAGGYY